MDRVSISHHDLKTYTTTDPVDDLTPYKCEGISETKDCVELHMRDQEKPFQKHDVVPMTYIVLSDHVLSSQVNFPSVETPRRQQALSDPSHEVLSKLYPPP